jgi:hypothetical protein
MTILNILAFMGSLFSIAGFNFALFSWMRSDLKQFESEIRGWKEEINKEIKDFHGRLCAIEERNKEKK